MIEIQQKMIALGWIHQAPHNQANPKNELSNLSNTAAVIIICKVFNPVVCSTQNDSYNYVANGGGGAF